MGEQNVKLNNDEATHQEFMKALLTEVHALEKMLDEGLVESGVRRIGAEQEMFLIDKAHKPAPKALEILEAIDSNQPIVLSQFVAFEDENLFVYRQRGIKYTGDVAI